MSGSFFALFDDLATVLDDVAAMTKLAAKKTSGVLGDDLALNAEQLRGLDASREVPVVLGVARGSFKNKCILVPVALAVSQFAAWAIGPMLVLGGFYLCYEGVEKLVHRARSPKGAPPSEGSALLDPSSNQVVDTLALENSKIEDAVRTDFILSAEIIVITLGTLGAHSFATRLAVLSAVAVLMTLGVYGVVIAILKLDDLGLFLIGRRHAAARLVGRGLVHLAPWLMRLLGVVGTAAVFLVGGGIVVHGIAPVHSVVLRVASHLPAPLIVTPMLEALSGIIAGGVCVGMVTMFRQIKALRPET